MESYRFIFLKLIFHVFSGPKFCSHESVADDVTSESVLKDFCIPDYILVPGSEVDNESHLPSCPVIVFINSKSGGQLGGELLVTYRTLLNKNQVNLVIGQGIK